jgi:hypothetical protein
MAKQGKTTSKLPERDLNPDRIGERVEQRNAVRPERRPGTARTDEHTVRRPARQEQRDRRRGGAPWWIWLLGLLALGLVAFMIFQGLDEDPTGAAAGSTKDVETVNGAGTDAAAAATGTVTSSDGADLLDVSGDSESLAGYENTGVKGASAPVESVVGDETFWVGRSPEQRLFVFLNLQGESGPDIDAGDDVTFDGTVKALPADFEQRLDISMEEGAAQLEEQGRYIEVTNIEEN